MTNWAEIVSFEGLLAQANAHAPFWTLILFMIWVVLIITFLPFGISIAIVGGSFIGALFGIFLVYMDLVAWRWVLGMFALILAFILFESIER